MLAAACKQTSWANLRPQRQKPLTPAIKGQQSLKKGGLGRELRGRRLLALQIFQGHKQNPQADQKNIEQPHCGGQLREAAGRIMLVLLVAAPFKPVGHLIPRCFRKLLIELKSSQNGRTLQGLSVMRRTTRLCCADRVAVRQSPQLRARAGHMRPICAHPW